MDNMIYSEVIDYASFDKAQSHEIRELINQYHHWHRTTQLPLYADFLKDLSERVYLKEPVAIEEVEAWAEQIRGFINNVNACHPLMFGTEIMTTLSNEQVEQIAKHSQEEYGDYLKQYQKREPDERLERRYRKTLKWFSRFQLSINADERYFLRETMDKEPKLSEASMQLWLTWDQKFYDLLLARSDGNFPELMKRHVVSLNTMLEDNYAEEVKQKLDLWIHFFHVIAQAELDEEEYGFAKWAKKMSKNLRVISQSVSAKQNGWDAQDYCEA